MSEVDEGLKAYMLLIKQDSEYGGSDTWWMKGSVEAVNAEAAVRKEYEDTYLSPNRKGSLIRRDRVAVTGPDTTWQEFEVTLLANPADIVSIEPREYRKDS